MKNPGIVVDGLVLATVDVEDPSRDQGIDVGQNQEIAIGDHVQDRGHDVNGQDPVTSVEAVLVPGLVTRIGKVKRMILLSRKKRPKKK